MKSTMRLLETEEVRHGAWTAEFRSGGGAGSSGLVVFSDDASVRWKVANGGRYWDENDQGADECDPNVPIGQQPQAGENTAPQFEVGLSESEGAPMQAQGRGRPGEPIGTAVRSCRAYTKQGYGGYISMQVNPVDGSLQWGAYMYDWSLN
jgi:hypothetical protein